jgi:hypothetical protein
MLCCRIERPCHRRTAKKTDETRRLMQPSKEAQDHAKSKVETYHIAAWESGVLAAKVRARQSAILRCAMTAKARCCRKKP